MAERFTTDRELVDIDSVAPHPDNPNLGNVPLLMESLRVLGQYNPILVQTSRRHIIAGNTTWKAAKALGWSRIAVQFRDCDDTEALALCLEDNRTADAGTIDEMAVYPIAQSLPSLEATGYAEEDLKLPEIDLSAYDTPEADPPAEDAGERNENPAAAAVAFRLGPHRGSVDPTAYESWRSHFPSRNSEALAEVLLLLGLVVPESSTPERAEAVQGELVPLSELRPYPGNPNQGDVGLLMHMLTIYGQTRPIVASRRTKYILRGHTVAKAAEALGWTELDVSWADVDADLEKRILLVDNRARQLAGFSLPDLGAAIAKLGTQGIEMTGYTLGDLDDIIAGKSPKLAVWTRSQMPFELGKLKAKVKTELVSDLNLTPGQELKELAAILGLDPDAVSQ
jgi:ParB-like chromosome segregation protein Spo0J